MRIEGRVEKVDAEESDAYFATRPLDSRIGAWASPQSQVIASRAVLVANAARYGAQFLLHPPRPPHWGGYRLVPDRWEFWQGRKSRLHDRLRYRLQDGAPGCASGWRPELRAPRPTQKLTRSPAFSARPGSGASSRTVRDRRRRCRPASSPALLSLTKPSASLRAEREAARQREVRAACSPAWPRRWPARGSAARAWSSSARSVHGPRAPHRAPSRSAQRRDARQRLAAVEVVGAHAGRAGPTRSSVQAPASRRCCAFDLDAAQPRAHRAEDVLGHALDVPSSSTTSTSRRWRPARCSARSAPRRRRRAAGSSPCAHCSAERRGCGRARRPASGRRARRRRWPHARRWRYSSNEVGARSVLASVVGQAPAAARTSTGWPATALRSEKRRCAAGPNCGSAGSASPAESTRARSTRTPALSVPSAQAHSSSTNSAAACVSSCPARRPLRRARRSRCRSICTPSTPRSAAERRMLGLDARLAAARREGGADLAAALDLLVLVDACGRAARARVRSGPPSSRHSPASARWSRCMRIVTSGSATMP